MDWGLRHPLRFVRFWLSSCQANKAMRLNDLATIADPAPPKRLSAKPPAEMGPLSRSLSKKTLSTRSLFGNHAAKEVAVDIVSVFVLSFLCMHLSEKSRTFFGLFHGHRRWNSLDLRQAFNVSDLGPVCETNSCGGVVGRALSTSPPSTMMGPKAAIHLLFWHRVCYQICYACLSDFLQVELGRESERDSDGRQMNRSSG